MTEGLSHMLEDFNLIVSTSRGNERNACNEIWYLLSEIGDSQHKVDRTGIIGLVTARSGLDPIEAVHRLRDVLRQKPWEFKYVLKVTPITRIVTSEVNAIVDAAREIAAGVKPGEKFRVTVEKRRTSISSRELIDRIAALLDREVDLEDPDKIILVEVVGPLTGLSLLEPDDILSIEKEKRMLRNLDEG
jgi:tRNA acetyltransferase TAN1